MYRLNGWPPNDVIFTLRRPKLTVKNIRCSKVIVWGLSKQRTHRVLHQTWWDLRKTRWVRFSLSTKNSRLKGTHWVLFSQTQWGPENSLSWVFETVRWETVFGAACLRTVPRRALWLRPTVWHDEEDRRSAAILSTASNAVWCLLTEMLWDCVYLPAPDTLWHEIATVEGFAPSKSPGKTYFFKESVWELAGPLQTPDFQSSRKWQKIGQKVPKSYFLSFFCLFWAYFGVCSVFLSCRGSRCSQELVWNSKFLLDDCDIRVFLRKY